MFYVGSTPDVANTLNGVSQALVPQPSDYPKWQRICGFLMAG